MSAPRQTLKHRDAAILRGLVLSGCTSGTTAEKPCSLSYLHKSHPSRGCLCSAFRLRSGRGAESGREPQGERRVCAGTAPACTATHLSCPRCPAWASLCAALTLPLQPECRFQPWICTFEGVEVIGGIPICKHLPALSSQLVSLLKCLPPLKNPCITREVERDCLGTLLDLL